MYPIYINLEYAFDGSSEAHKSVIVVPEKEITTHPGGKFIQEKVRTAVREALRKEYPIGSVNMRHIFARINNYKVYVGGIKE